MRLYTFLSMIFLGFYSSTTFAATGGQCSCPSPFEYNTVNNQIYCALYISNAPTGSQFWANLSIDREIGLLVPNGDESLCAAITPNTPKSSLMGPANPAVLCYWNFNNGDQFDYTRLIGFSSPPGSQGNTSTPNGTSIGKGEVVLTVSWTWQPTDGCTL